MKLETIIEVWICRLIAFSSSFILILFYKQIWANSETILGHAYLIILTYISEI